MGGDHEKLPDFIRKGRSTASPSRLESTPPKNPLAESPTSPHEVTIAFESNRTASLIFGQYDTNIVHLERRLGIVAHANGNHVTIKGTREACEHARRVLDVLSGLVKKGQAIRSGDLDGVIEETTLQRSMFPTGGNVPLSGFEAVVTRKRGPVKARTQTQDTYLRLLKQHELVFAQGPAGTGKTWLAVGHAVSLLEQGIVERMVLSRPAVEAGERLGFLPGDMREKVDPYLRPVYDALYDFMDARNVERALQTGMIEIAPLAFMRGRTLANAVVILDEAQNTTTMQMKMFLTRLGEGSRMIVTGDPSQIDLPSGQKSGLVEASSLLVGVEGVGHVAFKDVDVVRHDLVRRIVKAYDDAGKEASHKP
jgi:phosphate starvation-inducible protein PhoH and related proteins